MAGTAAIGGMIPAPYGVRRAPEYDRWMPWALLAIAFAVRCVTFGNPMPDFDEQLYLLVGDRLLHGHLPYVELWDRKPIGLFLFYAAIRCLGGSGIVQYQIVATLCVTGTAWAIFAMARRCAGPAASATAAIAYILLLNPFNGAGGQSPVIYNLLTAGAALCAFRATETNDPRRITANALFAMAAMGIAIQFKYTPVVEGVFFGCFFLWRLLGARATIARMTLAALAMIMLALLPTIFAIAFYAMTGHLDAFVQANFVSVFQRRPFPVETHRIQQVVVLFNGCVILAIAPFAIITRWRRRDRDTLPSFVLVTGWVTAAFVGFAMLGEFYDFYFITVLLPLCILVAPALGMGRIGYAAGCLLLTWPILATPHRYFQARDFERAVADLTEAVRPYVGQRCLYVYDGPAILYLTTNSCAPTRFIYPDHLNNPTEAPALGVDAAAEEARLLATHPGAIVTASRPVIPRVAPDTQRLLREALARDYLLVARVPSPQRTFYVWALRSLRPATGPLHDPRAATPY